MTAPERSITDAARRAVADAANLAPADRGARFHDTLAGEYIRSLPPDADIGAAYEALVGREIGLDSEGNPCSVGGRGRRRRGAYYTPPELVDELVGSSLAHLVEDRLRGARDAEAALLAIRVLDPACGPGAFLTAALEFLAARLAGIRGTDAPAAMPDVLQRCIYGVDTDPLAVEVCSLRLARLAGVPPSHAAGIRVGDSLLAPPPELEGQTFDCVLGNPPFLNAIERSGRGPRRAALAVLAPELGGTADEAFQFLALAMRVTAPDGRIGLVMPRTVLNAPSAEALRLPERTGWHPRYIHALDRHDHFRGPNVYVCLLSLGPEGACRVTQGGRSAEGRICDANWWRGMQALLGEGGGPEHPGPVVEDVFEVRAGMTAGDAYVIRPCVVDEPESALLKLVTTGLIDPGECLWGRRTCRYLGGDYGFPRISPGAEWSGALRRRMDEARRPKLIVAGLSSRIECIVDAAGEYAGAVSTFAVFHPRDDIAALSDLAASLLRPEATQRFHAELGANALGGGSVRMTKAFLRGFPLG